jgi:dTDP-4-dehydrorhamnose 3,5-epimerase
MKITALAIPDAFCFVPDQFPDSRGVFLEGFRQAAMIEHVGRPLSVEQVNCSVSRLGVVRGIHFADIPPSQAKYVTCVSGSVFDVVVDLRVGSPCYGRWDSVVLDDTSRSAVYIAEGLGHAFMALSDDATVVYLCSAPYCAPREHGIDPFDPAIGIDWPTIGVDGRAVSPLLSPKDEAAPTLADAAAQGLLPTYEQAKAFYASP